VLHPKPIAIRKETKMRTAEKEVEGMSRFGCPVQRQLQRPTCFVTQTPINNPDGGAHLSGFRNAVTRSINQYAKSNNLLEREKDPQSLGDDVRKVSGVNCS